MKTLGIIILVLIGGFTGLCSAGFLVMGVTSASDLGIILPFAAPGVLIAIGCYAGIRALTRRPASPAAQTPEPSPSPQDDLRPGQ